LQRLKRLDEALLTFDKVLAIDPNVVEAHYNRPIEYSIIDFANCATISRIMRMLSASRWVR